MAVMREQNKSRGAGKAGLRLFSFWQVQWVKVYRSINFGEF